MVIGCLPLNSKSNLSFCRISSFVMSHALPSVKTQWVFVSADIKSQKVRTLQAVHAAFNVLGGCGVSVLIFHVFRAPLNFVGSRRYNIVLKCIKKETGCFSRSFVLILVFRPTPPWQAAVGFGGNRFILIDFWACLPRRGVPRSSSLVNYRVAVSFRQQCTIFSRIYGIFRKYSPEIRTLPAFCAKNNSIILKWIFLFIN